MANPTSNIFPPAKEPDIESVHRDLALANAYRQEFIKSLILIAGALLGGFAQLAAWERFYASYQRFEWRGVDGKGRRKRITSTRRFALFCQVVGFVVGVAVLGSFTALNLANVEKTKPPMATAPAPGAPGAVAPAPRP